MTMDKTSPPAAPSRDAVPDTAALRALAHPDRLRMLGLLRANGPATATSLARRLGLNSGATSYHLRQLAQFGFIDEAMDLGNRRERWWRARHDSTRYDPAEMEGDELEVGLAMVQAVLSQHAALMQAALRQFPAESRDWRAASNASDYLLALTAEEAAALKQKLIDLLREAARAAPPDAIRADPGKRNFMVMLHTFPLPPLDGEASKD